jgi:hypothetical protein
MYLGSISGQWIRVALAAVVWHSLPSPANAIFWNNDPAHGVTSSSGLTDRVDWFQNVHIINNQSNNTMGTTTLLNSEWAITVRHVVQNGGNYSQITGPGNVYVNVFGRRYYADQILTPDGGSEMALVHLRGGVNGTLDATGQINSAFDEAGRLLHIGGYGYSGYFNGPGTLGLGAFHRAYNFGFIAGNGQIRIVADGEANLANNGLLEGTVGSGDSGGPMFAYYGRGFNVANAEVNDWRLVGLTATGTGGSGGEAFGGSSNYTRVANYSNWINSTLNSLPAPGPTSTGAWLQSSGNGLFDNGRDKISVTGSSALPAVQAPIGPGGQGFSLDAIGDTLSMTAIVDTTLALDYGVLRYGLFDDEQGTIPGNVAGGTAWRGYFASNATENAANSVHEKGPQGGGVGQWWSNSSPNTSAIVSRSTFAAGTYDDAAGTQITPAGRYAMSLDYTREQTGLAIDYSLVQIDALGKPTGVYSHAGSAFDPTPASSSWTFNQLGLGLYGGSFTGTIIVDDIQVRFVTAVPEPASLRLALILAGCLTARRRKGRYRDG